MVIHSSNLSDLIWVSIHLFELQASGASGEIETPVKYNLDKSLQIEATSGWDMVVRGMSTLAFWRSRSVPVSPIYTKRKLTSTRITAVSEHLTGHIV